MVGVIRSELLKTRHTGTEKLTYLAPLATAFLGFFLSGASAQYAAYNWWYVTILPVCATVWASAAVTREKNTGYQNILPLSPGNLWTGKFLAVAAQLFTAQIVLWLGVTAAGYLTMVRIPTGKAFLGCMLLFLTYLWQIPFVMLLTKTLGQLPAVLLSALGGIAMSIAGADKPWFLFDLWAIPARVVCPYFGIHPNGIPLASGSPMLDPGQVAPALCVSLLAAGVLLCAAPKLLGRGDLENG